MRRLRKPVAITLAVTLSVALVTASFVNLIDRTVAATLVSNTTASTAASPARATIYDTVNDRHWAFYDSGSVLEYAYSADSTTWTAAGTLAYDTNGLSAAFTIIGGTPYVFLAVECNDYDICLRRGTLSTASIAFDSEQTAMNGSVLTGAYYDPAITIDSGSYLYIAAAHEGVLGGEAAAVTRSTNTATGNLSAWDTTEVLGVPTSSLSGLVFAGKDTANVMLVIGNESGHVTAHQYNAGTWEEKGENDTSWFDFLNPGFEDDVRASVVIGQDIYFAGDF
jgi:hypothetical protein